MTACLNCDAPLSPSRVNLADLVVVCERCNYPQSVRVDEAAANVMIPAKVRSRFQAFYPTGEAHTRQTASPHAQEMMLSFPTGIRQNIVVAGLTAVFMIVCSVGAIVQTIGSPKEGAWTQLAIILFCVLPVLYGCAAVLFDRTIVEVTQERISVRHRPIPLPWPRDVARARVERVHVRTTYTKARTPVYSVCVRAGGNDRALARGLLSYEETLFIGATLKHVLTPASQATRRG